MRIHTLRLSIIAVLSIAGVCLLSLAQQSLGLSDAILHVATPLGLVVPTWCYLVFLQFGWLDRVPLGKLVRNIGPLALLTAVVVQFEFQSALVTASAACVAVLFGLLVAAFCYWFVQSWRSRRA